MNTVIQVVVGCSAIAAGALAIYSARRMAANMGDADAIPLPDLSGPPEPANDDLPDLTVDQLLVLAEMSEDYGRTAARMAKDTGLPHATVTEARRHLRKLGLAKYGPLFDEDMGTPNGSGYTLTPEGVRVRAALEVHAAVAWATAA